MDIYKRELAVKESTYTKSRKHAALCIFVFFPQNQFFFVVVKQKQSPKFYKDFAFAQLY